VYSVIHPYSVFDVSGHLLLPFPCSLPMEQLGGSREGVGVGGGGADLQGEEPPSLPADNIHERVQGPAGRVVELGKAEQLWLSHLQAGYACTAP